MKKHNMKKHNMKKHNKIMVLVMGLMLLAIQVNVFAAVPNAAALNTAAPNAAASNDSTPGAPVPAELDKQIAIVLEGSAVDSYALERDGCLYLPLRAVAEKLGYVVTWSRKGNTAALVKEGSNITIGLTDHKITTDDHSYYLDGDYSGDVQSGIILVNNRSFIGKNSLAQLFGLKVMPGEKNESVVLKRIKSNDISIRTVKETSEDKYLKLTIQYPEISGLESKTAQDAINAALRKAAANAREEGLKYAAEMKSSVESGYTGSPNKCETFFNYRIRYNTNGLLSVVFEDYQYTGGAHGLTVQSSHTFSLADGSDYKIGELFGKGSDYISVINSEVKLQIGERVKSGLLPEQALTPFETIKPEQDYYLSAQGLVIYFQQYEYYPYAAGIQEFNVPFEKLEGMLKEQFSGLQAE